MARCFLCSSRVVIISTVRSSERFLKDDHRLNRGIVREAKRFNVALTRARELSIIVGNGSVLKVYFCLLYCTLWSSRFLLGRPVVEADIDFRNAKCCISWSTDRRN